MTFSWDRKKIFTGILSITFLLACHPIRVHALNNDEEHMIAVYYGNTGKIKEMIIQRNVEEFKQSLPDYLEIEILDNYPNKENIFFRGEEYYYYNESLGKIVEITEEMHPIIENIWGIIYNTRTGLIFSMGCTFYYAPATEEDRQNVISTLQCNTLQINLTEPYHDYCILENYPEAELSEIFENPFEYVFDIETGRIRKATVVERQKAFEFLYGKADDVLDYIEQLADNRNRAVIRWGDYKMYAETNSSVLEVKFHPETKQLFIKISGENGTSGELILIVPQELIPSAEDVKVYVDGSVLEYTRAQSENHYFIHVEYVHSQHMLTVSLGAPPAWYEQPLTIAAIAGAIVVLIAALWLVRRRRH